MLNSTWNDDSLGQTMPLSHPSALIVVQFHIESFTEQLQMSFVFSCSFLINMLWFIMSYAADRSTKAAPVTIHLW